MDKSCHRGQRTLSQSEDRAAIRYQSIGKTASAGGDALGSASDQLYQPEGLIRQAKSNGQPVIFVGINYRLGSMSYALLHRSMQEH
ncbi:MAG: hypothetical protein Q9166_007685 [cf. Caloplaca sp. 2 TL-2023]